MYKLLLCLRYLRKLLMAYFAILCVALCVAMMLIVTNVMNGFLDKIETAAKGLFGDIVIDAPGLDGLSRYDEFIARLTADVPEVQAASPFIMTYALLRIPHNDHRQMVQVAGIRLPERADATDFEKGLFVQKNLPKPTFDPPVDLIVRRLSSETESMQRILARLQGAREQQAGPDASQLALIGQVQTAIARQHRAAARLSAARGYQDQLAQLQKMLGKARKQAGGADSDEVDNLLDEILKTEELSGLNAPANHIILGLGLPALSLRTPLGETVRVIGPGEKIVLSLIPLGRRLGTGDISPVDAEFTVVDDCSTDVSSIDSSIVYIPFETLQRLNNMDAEYLATDPTKVAVPPRCGQIHIKVQDDLANGDALRSIRDKVEEAWLAFHGDRPVDATIETWHQHQAKFIGPIETQRTLTIIMFSIISTVSVVLIFVIFYMIVYQKIRDIGVLKAIGASSSGVAWIFLSYGAAVGLVGAVVGLVGGWYFVRYINNIQDAVDRWFGFRVWSREVFMFERIPSHVSPSSMVLIAIGAIVAGLLGALAPAIRASRMQPVEALRYE
ncbi:MAG: ABC transporter permease [Planctomycetes bacterium]|nr:ABC transporter permease [Planctomycetota bacterium]